MIDEQLKLRFTNVARVFCALFSQRLSVCLRVVLLTLISSLVIMSSHHLTLVYAESDLRKEVSFKEKKEQDGYIVDLKKLIKTSKKKIEKVDEKLKEQARVRRNQKREAKSREYYEKAMRYYEEEKYAKARELWEKAIKVTEHKEMDSYITMSPRKQKDQNKAFFKAQQRRLKRLEVERGFSAKEVEDTYRSGVKLYKKKKYLQAKVDFEAVDQMFPGHRATSSYLMLIDQEIADEQKQLIEQKLEEGSVELTRQKKEDWKKELLQKEKTRQKKLDQKAEEIYQDAVAHYKMKDYESAKRKFKEVEWVLPGYKRTINYLSRIDKDIQRNGVNFSEKEKLEYFKNSLKEEKLVKQEKADRLFDEHKRNLLKEKQEANLAETQASYETAIKLYKKKYYNQSRDKFLEVRSLTPGYRSSERYLNRLAKVLGEDAVPAPTERMQNTTRDRLVTTTVGHDANITKAIENRQRQLVQQADDKYYAAIRFYQGRNFVEAQRKFIAVEALSPNFRDTRDYLKRIDDDILKDKKDSNYIPNVIPRTDWPSPVSTASVVSKDGKVSVSDRQKSEAVAVYNQGLAYYKSGDYTLAKERFLKAQKLDPKNKKINRYIKKSNKKVAKSLKKSGDRQQPKTASVKIPDVKDGAMSVAVQSDQKGSMEVAVKTKGNKEGRKKDKKQVKKKSISHLSRKEKASLRKHHYRVKKEIKRLEKEEIARRHSVARNVDLAKQRAIREQENLERKQMRSLKKNILSHPEHPLAKSELPPSIFGSDVDPAILAEAIRREEVRVQKEKTEKLEKEKMKAAKKQARNEKKPQVKVAPSSKEENVVPSKSKELLAKDNPKSQRDVERIRKRMLAQKKKNEREQQREAEKVARRFVKEKEALLQKSSTPRNAIVGHSLPTEYPPTYEEYVNPELVVKGRSSQAENEVPKSKIPKEKKESKGLFAFLKKSPANPNAPQLAKQTPRTTRMYEEALLLYKDDQLLDAKIRFQKVNQMAPGYKATDKYLKRIQRQLQRRNEDFRKKSMAEQRRSSKMSLPKLPLMPKEPKPEFLSKPLPKHSTPKVMNEVSKDRMYEQQRRQMAKMDRLTREDQYKVNEKSQHRQLAEIRREQEKDFERMKRQRVQHANNMEKMRDRVIKEHENDNQRRITQDHDRIRTKLDGIYDEAVTLYKKKRTSLAGEKFKQYTDLLRISDLPEKEIKSRTKKLRKERDKLDRYVSNLDKGKVKGYGGAKEISPYSAETLEYSALDYGKGKDLDELQSRIAEEEKRLAYERNREHMRLEEIRLRGEDTNRAVLGVKSVMDAYNPTKLDPVQTEIEVKTKAYVQSQMDLQKQLEPQIVEEPERVVKKVIPLPIKSHVNLEGDVSVKRDRSVASKRVAQRHKQLEHLVQERKSDLRSERTKIRKEFDQNLHRLYGRAVDLYKKGYYQQSSDLFAEINIMKPGYKGTDKYLSKIDNSIRKNSLKPATPKSEPAYLYARPVEASQPRKNLISQALDAFEEKLW